MRMLGASLQVNPQLLGARTPPSALSAKREQHLAMQRKKRAGRPRSQHHDPHFQQYQPARARSASTVLQSARATCKYTSPHRLLIELDSPADSIQLASIRL